MKITWSWNSFNFGTSRGFPIVIVDKNWEANYKSFIIINT